MKKLLPALVPVLLFSLPGCRGPSAHEEHASGAKPEAKAEAAHEEKEESEEQEGEIDMKAPATSLSAAVAKALKSVPDGRFLQAVVEEEGGKTICSVLLASGEDVREVNLDATTGEVIATENEKLGDDAKKLLAAVAKDPAHPPASAVKAIEAAVAKVQGSWALAADLSGETGAPAYRVYLVAGHALKLAEVSVADGSVQKVSDAKFEEEEEGAEGMEEAKEKEKKDGAK